MKERVRRCNVYIRLGFQMELIEGMQKGKIWGTIKSISQSSDSVILKNSTKDKSGIQN